RSAPARRRPKNQLSPTLMKKIAIQAFVVQLIMAPSSCRNVMDGEKMALINSRQVEAFRAMMLTGSVTEAAKLMAVTQPAVSRLLRDFQALRKMELFEKRG